MAKTFAIVSNISNGAGLQRDYELMKRMLESYGHTVYGEMFNANCPTLRRVDVVIFLEVVDVRWLQFAPEIWLVPNSEWWGVCWDGMLSRVTRVLCKTQDCLKIWTKKVGSHRCVYTGWEANDFYQPDVKRLPTFLHLAGKSETKNTATVMAAWRDYRLPFPLVVSAFKPNIVALCNRVPNVRQVERFPENEAQHIINECQFHIMPSKYEGFGMAIHEALGCKGMVLTTDAPPMNEFQGVDRRGLIPVWRQAPRNNLTPFYEVAASSLADAVIKAAALPAAELEAIGEKAREGFLAERDYFRRTFYEVAHAA